MRTRARSCSAIVALLLAASLVLGVVPAARAKGGFELWGDVAQIAVPVFAAGTSIAKRDGQGVAMLAVGTGVTLGTVWGLKHGVDSERPDGGARSFPSGHTASAFSGASYLHYRYGWQWGLPAYAVASLVGASRVEADRHYWYDVVAGAAIANLIAFVVTDTVDESVVVIPVVEFGKPNFGLIARFRF